MTLHTWMLHRQHEILEGAHPINHREIDGPLAVTIPPCSEVCMCKPVGRRGKNGALVSELELDWRFLLTALNTPPDVALPNV